MHWHQDNSASASKFFPSKGRIGKKMSGGANKTAILREKTTKLFNQWVKLYEKKNGIEPLGGEQRYAIDNPQWILRQIEHLSGPTLTFRHKVSCNCKGCVDDRPNGEGPWSQVLKTSVDAIRAREAEAKRLEAEAKAIAAAKIAEQRRKFQLRISCPIPQKVLKRYMQGVIGADIIKATFGNFSAEQLEEYCNAFFVQS